MSNDAQNEIRAALAKLDAGNDNHWTENGLPRLDALGFTKPPLRADVTAAAPLFNRSNTVVEVVTPEAPKEPEIAVPTSPTHAELDVLQRELDAAEQVVRDRQAEVAAGQREVAVAQVKRDELVRKLDRARPMHENILGIRAVLERGKETRAANAEIAKQLREVGVTAKLLTGKSPLDMAMARKRGFGLNRPNVAAGAAAGTK